MQRKLVILAGLIALSAVATPVVILRAQQITDSAEYNTYMTAFSENDPAKKIPLIDAYLAKYPNSVMKEQVLDSKLTAQQATNQPVEATARQIIAVNPNNARALLVLSFLFNQSPSQDAAKQDEAAAIAKRGIEQLNTMKKPDNVPDADWTKSKNITGSQEYQTLALIGALRKDDAAAVENYKKAAELAPNDGTIFYQIGSAYDRITRAAPATAMDVKQLNTNLALWYFARAVGIEGLPAAGKPQVDAYLVNLYKRYHGSDEGLQQLRDQAKGSMPFPPADFHIKTTKEMEPPPPPPPPPPAIPEDITTMPFSLIKQVLDEGNDRSAQVLTKLKAAGFGSEGVVVSATPAALAKTVKIAVIRKTQETEDAFDVVITLAAAKAGLTKGKKVEFEGTVKAYTDGALEMTAGKVTPVAPAKPGKK